MLELFDELECYKWEDTVVCEDVINFMEHVKDSKYFNIVHFNIRSLNKNYDQFFIISSSFRCE